MKFASLGEQYKKYPEIKKEQVRNVIKFVNGQPHLPKITELEAFIFLHYNGGSYEKTRLNIDDYYTSRTKFTNFFSERDVLAEDMQQAMETFLVTTLPELSKEGHLIILCRIIDADASKFSLNAVLKFNTLIADMTLMETGANDGIIVLLDLEGATMGHVAKLGIMPIKHYMYYIQEVFPVQIKGFHILNAPSFMDKILFFVKPFMNQEFLEVFHIHESMHTLYTFVEPQLLPSSYEGGMAPSIKELHISSNKHLIDNQEYFLEEERTRRVNNRRRLVKEKSFWMKLIQGE